MIALLAAALAAPDAPAAKPSAKAPEEVTLAAPPFETHGFSKREKDVAFYSEHFAGRLTANGIQVITTQQISTVREMEKLRQLAGCPATSADCIIEMGHMLGAVGVVRGTLAKVGETFQVDVRVYNSSDGKVIAARSANARTSEALLRALDLLAVETAGLVKAAFGIKTPEPVKPKPPPVADTPPPKPLGPPPPPPMDLRPIAWVPAVAGLVGLAGGGICLGLAQGERAKLEGGNPSLSQAMEIRNRGELLGSIGIGAAAGGGLALLTAGALRLFGAPGTAVSIAPAPSGVTVEVKLP
ncbi:MAG TPA: hypothetical protein VIG99_14175 [Myxococcaceae bacterium]|jgi:hypothetical protein